MKKLLTIAGSDSSGGAGIQADLKTFCAHNCYAMSVITALTAQNTCGVFAVEDVSPLLIEEQIKAIYDDLSPDAVKIGMLSKPETAQTVIRVIKKINRAPLILDPVMVSKSGDSLLAAESIVLLKNELLPLATVITPNIPEAEQLTGVVIKTLDDTLFAAKKLVDMGANAALVKGGHQIKTATDILWDGANCWVFKGEKIKTKSDHGTGCTLSSAIACELAQGEILADAVQHAKIYLTGALSAAIPLGHGHGPVNHFWRNGKDIL